MPPVVRPQLPLLTTLRFFAAFQVLMVHAVSGQRRSSWWFGPLISAGDQAVIFFFALSGFILAYNYSEATETGASVTPPSTFYRARFARLAPAYYLGLLVALPYFGYQALVARTVPYSEFFGGLVLVPLFLQAWYPPTELAWNGVAWSLSVEWFFYALFPLLLALARRLHRVTFLVGAGVLLVVTQLVRPPSLATIGLGGNWPPFHLATFLLGMAAGRIFLFGPTLSPGTHRRIFLAASAAIIVLLGMARHEPNWLREDLVIVPLFCLAIFGGARTGTSFKVLTGPIFLLLGEASYALYILHAPMGLWNLWIQRTLDWRPADIVDTCIFVPFAISASILCFLYVETPLRRKMMQRVRTAQVAPV